MRHAARADLDLSRMRRGSDTACDQEPARARRNSLEEDHEEIRVSDLTTATSTASALLQQPLDELMDRARAIRDARYGTRITYSPKVFIPLTMLCRDKCGYCTFAKAPAHIDSPFLTPEQVLSIASAGARAGCHEALFTLGERPELRYPVA